MNAASKHWTLTRLLTLPLILLFFYFLSQIEYMASRTRMEFISWVKQPVVTIAIVIFIVCSFYHACLGMDEIIEDYVDNKKPALLANRIIFLVLGIAAVYATLAISFGKF